MFKWILWTTLIFGWLGYYLANASYVPISKQIDVKTMQIHSPSYIIKKSNSCSGSCRNYSSSSSYGGSSYGGK
jgi:hypothetical protein